MGQTGVIKIVDFVFLPYISFHIAFTALEWIPCMESLYSQSRLPQHPLMGQIAVINSRFSVFVLCLLLNYSSYKL